MGFQEPGGHDWGQHYRLASLCYQAVGDSALITCRMRQIEWHLCQINQSGQQNVSRWKLQFCQERVGWVVERGRSAMTLSVLACPCWTYQIARLLHLPRLSSFCSWSHRQLQVKVTITWLSCDCLLSGKGRLACHCFFKKPGLGLELLFCSNPLYVQMSSGSIIYSPEGLGSKRNDASMLRLMLLAVLWAIKYFVSDPGVSWLQLEPMKLWQLNLQAWKKG